MGLKTAARKGKDAAARDPRQLHNQASDHELQVPHILAAPLSA